MRLIDFLINFMVPYILGVVCAFLMFHPVRKWKDGYDAARETYGNWDKGYDEGWKASAEMHKDYDRGFGDGFDAGWRTALERREEGENQ